MVTPKRSSAPVRKPTSSDWTAQALELAGARLASYTGRTTLVHAVYDEIRDVLNRLGIDEVQGVLFDLGVSSLQLDEADRGFAYAQDAPLDMRMDPTTGKTAAELLNTYSVQELTRILSRYGEERFARAIARTIVREREKAPFDTSARLVELVRASIPAPARRTGGNPAKRTFQALRIEVNDELGVLERALPAAVDALALGGRIVVMSYHSLEDKLAKRLLTSRSRSSAPPDLPVVPEDQQPDQEFPHGHLQPEAPQPNVIGRPIATRPWGERTPACSIPRERRDDRRRRRAPR